MNIEDEENMSKEAIDALGDVAIEYENRLVGVCSHCKCAACWQGLFFCDDYKTAGVEYRPIKELRALNLEHRDFWEESDA